MTNTPNFNPLDQTGQIDVLTQLLGPIAQLLQGVSGFDPNNWALNQLTGSPFGGMQARMGGRTPRIHDIMVHQSQQKFFEFSSESMDNYKTRLAENLFGMAFPADTAAQKAQNAMSSIYNPVGMGLSFATMALGEQGANQAYATGFMGMNIHPPTLGSSMYGVQASQDRQLMEGAVKNLKDDFLNNMADYGGFNMQGAGEVFQQMSQRSLIGKGDIKGRAADLTQKVRDMSQAVGAMQELFGGTIPEVFDKMDAIFGGNAGAMGGQQLLGRVMRLKQTSMVTGQSLQAVAQMSIMGQQYAAGAGMDEGIGATAGLESALQFGVNYADGGFGTRRINQGQLKQMSLRANVAGATSRGNQYYAGAYIAYLNRVGKGKGKGGTDLTYGNMTAAQRRQASMDFASIAGNANTIGQLAAAAGVSTQDVRDAAMQDYAFEAMADDPTIAQRGMRARNMEIESEAVAAMRARLGGKLSDDVFMRNGRLLGTDEIVKNIEATGRYKGVNVRSLVNQELNSLAESVGLKNGQTMQAHLYQERNSGQLRKLRDIRAQHDQILGVKAGGTLGILNYLAGDDEKSLGGALGAFFGVMAPEEVRDKMRKAGKSEAEIDAYFRDKGGEAAKAMRATYQEAMEEGDYTKAGKIQTVLKSVLDTNKMGALKKEDRDRINKAIEAGNLTGDELTFAFDKLASEDQLLADKTLKESGLGDRYTDALGGDSRLAVQKVAREAAVTAATKGIKDKKTREAVAAAMKGSKFENLRDAKERLKDVQFAGGEEARSEFFQDLERRASALNVGDKDNDLTDVLSKLVDAINGLNNKQPAKPGGDKD